MANAAKKIVVNAVLAAIGVNAVGFGKANQGDQEVYGDYVCDLLVERTRTRVGQQMAAVAGPHRVKCDSPEELRYNEGPEECVMRIVDGGVSQLVHGVEASGMSWITTIYEGCQEQ